MIVRRYLVFAALILLPVSSAVWPQTAGGGIFGRIVDAESGQPVPDAKATLVDVLDPDRRQPFGGLLPITVAADGDGAYAFPASQTAKLASGALLLYAWAPRYGFAARRLERRDGLGAQDFLLPKTVIASGRVADATGAPVALAEVGVVYDDPSLEGSSAYFPWQYASRQTDAEGRYEVEVSPGLDFAVEAYHEDFLPAITDLMRVEAGGAPQTDLVLQSGVRLEGRLMDSSGRAASGVQVQLSSRSRRLPRANSRAFAKLLDQTATSGPDGRFVFKAVAPGPKDLIASNGRAVARRRLEASASVSDLVLTLAPR